MGWFSPSLTVLPSSPLPHGARQVAWGVLLGFAEPRHVEIFTIQEQQVWNLGGQGAENGFFVFFGNLHPII